MSEEEVKILDSIWFTPRGFDGCIGIVVAEIRGQIKFYIGIGSGEDQRADERSILRNGAKFYHSYMEVAFDRWKEFCSFSLKEKEEDKL